MATHLTENSIAGDSLIFEEIIKKAYRNIETIDTLTLLRKMVNDGVIQVDGLFEKAVSVVGKLDRDSTEGRDFADGSDAKKATTFWQIGYPSASNSLVNPVVRRRADIKNLKNKKGVLRCIIAETHTNKVYYFRIPASVYRGKKKISIDFDKNGIPNGGKYWQWECKSFSEMVR